MQHYFKGIRLNECMVYITCVTVTCSDLSSPLGIKPALVHTTKFGRTILSIIIIIIIGCLSCNGLMLALYSNRKCITKLLWLVDIRLHQQMTAATG